MGFFSSEEKEAPRPQIMETPWGPQNRNFLSGLIGGQMPLQQIAGMTGTEQQAQGLLSQLLSGGTFQDPSTSQYYEGFRRASQAEEDRGASTLRRRAQLAGMGSSSPALQSEGRYRSDMANNRMSMLGGLYNQERNRDNPYTRLAAVQQYGSLPRDIQNQQGQSQFNQAMAPYTYQAPLAQNMLNYQPWYQPQMMSEPSGFAQTMGPIGGVLGGVGNLFSGMGDWRKSRSA